MKYRTFTTAFLLLASAAFLPGIVASGNESNEKFNLLFRTGSYPVAENLRQFVNDFSALAADNELHYRIIQFNEIPNLEKRNTLAAAGITLLDYLPNMAYYAAVAPHADASLLKVMNARAVVEIKPEYRLDFDLFTGDYPEHALRPGNRIELFVHYFEPVEKERLIKKLVQNEIQFVGNGYIPGYMVVSAPVEQLNWLASQNDVLFIEPVEPPAVHDNYTGTTLHRSTAINSPHPLGRKYDGSGVNVMLQDDGVIGPHIDYQGRIVEQFITWNNGNHGDHCAGTIMGSGNRDPRTKGMAPGANIYVYGVSSTYQGFELIPTHYFDRGIRITSTSYSNGCNAGYNTLARTMDQQSRMYPLLVHVFSAGNAGTDNCGYGAGAGWGNITGGHKAGKNVIAVGNVGLTDALSNSSSRGPAFDGRIKPEVVAKGTSVNSTVNPDTYSVKSGTSMACPGVSGTLAQLYQAYKNLNDAEPNGGLMKAIVMNSADDMGNTGPDFRFGFGRINALRAAQTIEQQRYLTNTVEQGGSMTHNLNVPENVEQLRIMIYWTDFESTVGTNFALVNNLNMMATDPNSTSYLPWVLSHFPHADSLNKLATRKVDNRNNVEQVTVNQPAAGTWQILVDGFQVPQGPQTYFITWEFITKDLQITHPIGGESFVPGETELIRWDSPYTNVPFTLEFSPDNGNTWSLIGNNISGNLRHFEWTPPATVTGQAWFRLTQGDQTVMNEYPFSIIGVPQNLVVNWVCASNFRISWNEVYGAESYVVRKLGAKYMDSIGVTNTTSFLISDPSTSISWVSVQALGVNGAVGQRANAVRKNAGLTNCPGLDMRMEVVNSAPWMLYNLSNIGSYDFPVEVGIRNFGPVPASNFQVGFSLNNNIVAVQNIAGELQPGELFTYQFTESYAITQPGIYTLKAWVKHSNDNVPANDTLTRQIRVVNQDLIIPVPAYQQNFDNFTRCSTAPDCEQVVCDVEAGWFNLTNLAQDQIDWRTWGGSTPTSQTGPTFDNTTGNLTGNYLFLRASTNCFNKTAILVSPSFDLSNAASGNFSFYYHMYGAQSGRIHVDAFMNNTIYYDIMPPLVGEKGNQWLQATISLDDFVGNIVSFRFRGVTGPGQLSDIAIDDVSVEVENLNVLPGDASCDGAVNVIDVIVSIDFITGFNPQPFCFSNADLNGDGMINVADVIGIINIVLGNTAQKTRQNSAPASIYLNNDRIVLSSDGTLAGLQFEIEGLEPGQMKFMLQNHRFTSNMINGKLVGVIFSTGNEPLPAGEIILFEFGQTSGLKWGEVLAANQNASMVKVNKFVGEHQLTVFPNPATYQLNIHSNQVIEFLRISNQLGQPVKEETPRTENVMINTSGLKKGIYILEVRTGSSFSVQKIVIE